MSPGKRRSRPNTIPRYPLILCASLVKNPMNLGALCRTAEVLGLGPLVLPHLDVMENWQFRQLAASAHHWQPLTACAPSSYRNGWTNNGLLARPAGH